jgi:hypothetical protein
MPDIILTGGADIANGANSGPVFWPGGTGQLEITGTWGGGGTLQLQKRAADGTTWVTTGSSGLFNADGIATIDFPECYLRLLGAVATTSAVSARITPTHIYG